MLLLTDLTTTPIRISDITIHLTTKVLILNIVKKYHIANTHISILNTKSIADTDGSNTNTVILTTLAVVDCWKVIYEGNRSDVTCCLCFSSI